MIETVGAVAQLGEHLLCKQGVSGSIPLSSTNSIGVELAERYPWRNKSLHRLDEVDACSDYIVKRRYVWKLPGVEDGRKIVGDVRAQIQRNHGWSSRPDVVEGLEVGRKSCPRDMDVVWVSFGMPFWCSCWIGVA